MKISFLILMLSLVSSPMLLAQGQRPDSDGQGRPEQSQPPQQSENGSIRDKEDRMREREANMEEASEENRESGRPENPGSMGEQMREENARGPDLERLQEDRGEEDRTEAGQGSEQGQASREENSRKWWRFWE